jgi:tetratricopeptide (TPR) repeat protein
MDKDEITALSFNVKDKFGCEYDTRNIIKFSNGINLNFKLENKLNPKRILTYFYKGKEIVFDVFVNSAPETEKIRDVVFFKNKNILALLHGYFAFVGGTNNTVDVSSAFYRISIYKRYKNFLLKLYMPDSDFEGIDGFYHGYYLKYKYKYHRNFIQKIKNKKITNKLILSSLITFLKPNYEENYDSIYTAKDSPFDLAVLKAILTDIKITQKTLTPYNNIAYYLQKAGANKEAVYLLEKIITKFPNRTVAYYNLGDAYWALGDKKKAIKAYTTYIEQMCHKGLQKKIPKEVLERVENIPRPRKI